EMCIRDRRRRAAVAARHEALALGLRRKDGTGALLGARDRLAGLLGPAAELLTVEPGYEIPVAAALGTAADAVAVTDPATAAAAIRLLRERDAGRAAMLLGGVTGGAPETRPHHVPEQSGESAPGREEPGGQVPVPGRPGEQAAVLGGPGEQGPPPERSGGQAPVPGQPGEQTPVRDEAPHSAPAVLPGQGGAPGEPGSASSPTGQAAVLPLPHGRAGEQVTVLAAPAVADLVRGPAALVGAVRRLVTGMVVVATLEDAEELVAAQPGLTAVTGEGDVLSAHFAHGGSAGAPSLLEVQASVDEAAAELADLAVRCEELAEAQRLAGERRTEQAALVEELGERRRAAEREKSGFAQQLGRLAGTARSAAGEAERMTASAARAQEALERATEEAEELAERLLVAEETPAEEEPDTSVRDRLAADGANARQTEMEARLQARTHEERVKALAGRADALDRAARTEREARARAEQRRTRLRYEAEVASAVASGARQLLAHVEVSLVRADEERTSAEAAKGERERELAVGRDRGRELKGELDKLTDSVHRGEVLGAEKRLRIEQLETKALEELGVEPAGLVSEYGPDQLVPPSPAAEGEELPEDPEHPRNQPKPYRRPEQEKRLRSAERAYQQLGKVNPLALEEFSALEERHKFLSEQLEDLKKTRADLLQVIKEVDERVEQVFTEAYHDTARQFEGVFSRLFPGGEGRLILTDPDNMLTTGVDVEARPPGKKVKRLSLLSGGERSLTAVALLVSIFKARPSPFYVMDEVEAALDDTNLQRLIRIMEELQESSQLIVITHQKRTMEVADALYGVSMQGDGVSKVISQRLR
ncbi:AAA family ATPase, partial [Streptomyces sp. st140]|uniref:AAA family ATPase n=1 Tax=Streptomyces sp. st140 TaxID=1828052 RepID=UPI0015CF71CE